MKFSLLDFNTQGTPLHSPMIRERYKKFCELINKEAPDIICFQEISTYYNYFLLKKYLKYPYVFFKPFLHAPKGGLVIASKMPLEDIQFVEYKTHGTFKDVSRMTHIIRNGLLLARIKDTALTIVNTHTFSDFEYEWSPTNKFYRFVKAHVEQLAVEVNKLTDKGQSIILTGDFNNKKNSTLYKYFRAQTKMSDVFGNESFPTYYKARLNYTFKGKIDARIDFMYLKENTQKIKVLATSHLFNKEETIAKGKKSYLSDHIGLQASFELP